MFDILLREERRERWREGREIGKKRRRERRKELVLELHVHEQSLQDMHNTTRPKRSFLYALYIIAEGTPTWIYMYILYCVSVMVRNVILVPAGT